MILYIKIEEASYVKRIVRPPCSAFWSKRLQIISKKDSSVTTWREI